MKRIRNIILSLALVIAFGIQTACTDGFETLNTNPASLPEVSPEELFYTAEIQTLTSGHCWNTIYASKLRWMQYGAGIWGYALIQYDYFSNNIGNEVYNEYNNMGSYVTHIRHLIDQMDDNKKGSYENLKHISRILLISKGIQTSDMFGSLAYSEAWLAREGKVDDESMTPRFETQEELSVVWDTQLKEAIDGLKAIENSTNLVSLRGHDRAYNGDITKWIKAANGIRLRLASRLWNIKPDVAKTIATEVLNPSNSMYIFESKDDSFILWYDVLYTNIHPGDWHSIVDMDVATYAFMDYLNKNEDPRREIYFQINNLTPENIKAYNIQNDNPLQAIPEDYTRWMGSTASRDKFEDELNRLSLSVKIDDATINMRPANSPQVRLWKGNENDGNGGNWAPIMTHADFSLLAAEFVLIENIPSSKTAKEWYEGALSSSISQWNEIGRFCDIYDYQEIKDSSIEAFLEKDDIKWNPSNALEQIHAQMYVEHFKNIDEGFAIWKRTDYPNTQSSIIKWETPYINGVAKVPPRRVKFSYPNQGVHNYENLKERLDVMVEDSKFGEIQNEYGRVWWDK